MGRHLLIKVDIDGVLRDWNSSLIDEFRKRYAESYVHYPFRDFDINPDFPDGVNIRQFYLEEAPYEIYTQAKPYNGAIQFIEWLVREFPNVWLVSTQYPNTMYPTMVWLEKNIPSSANLPLVFSKSKGLVGLDKFSDRLLIDDAPHNLVDEEKCGGYPICFGQSYNRNKVTCVGFYDNRLSVGDLVGDVDFSREHEDTRVANQFKLLQLYLKTHFHP